MVGVNQHLDETRPEVETLYIDEAISDGQCTQLDELRAQRDATEVYRTLDRLRDTARGTDNLMPPLLDAVRAYATLGEMCDALRDVWGEYEEPASL